MYERSGRLADQRGFAPFTDEVVSEATPKRVRAVKDGEPVLDSIQARLAWVEGPTPQYAVPAADVDGQRVRFGDPFDDDRLGTVEPVGLDGGRPERAHGLRVVDPPPSAPGLEDHVLLAWDAVDEWYVEDERQRGHPRDPYHRIDLHTSSREVVVDLDEARLATSTRPLMLVETGLPVRFYLPPEDVRSDLLEESSTRTRCAYKGQARYWHAHGRGSDVEDAAWSYEEPVAAFERLAGWVCFDQAKVDVIVDGEPLGEG
ncbi:hypothetical protein BRD56_05695 [Thermoplasmatales archaeon SW_10_69_26]|nr:MAG: hypothetical protein BRD56_05695 [Thermoplasmatales archaeon SW_10_69_26]